MTTGVGSVQDRQSLYRKDYARAVTIITYRQDPCRDRRAVRLRPRPGRGPGGCRPAGCRLIMQTALEAEVAEFLGRARYQRREQAPEARPGSRNGFCPTTVKSTAGAVTLDRPKLRGTDEAFCSRLFGTGVSKTNALETLVIAGFVRGLSVRDVEACLADALGPQAALSKSTVSRVCQAIRGEFDTWRGRRLDEVALDYLFCDASHFAMHPGARAEPILAAWGITTAGKPVLIGLEVAANEGNDAWDDFLDGL